MLAPFTLVFFLFLKLVRTLLWAIWKHKNILGYFRNLGSLRYRNEYCMYGKFPFYPSMKPVQSRSYNCT